MRICDRCNRENSELFCTSCGGEGHSGCRDNDGEDVCGACWAVLAHVDGEVSCASRCDCEELYADDIAAAR